MTIYRIDFTMVPTWDLIDDILPSQLIFSWFIFAVLFLLPDLYFELRTHESERSEKIIIQQKYAPFPFVYSVMHNRAYKDYFIHMIGFIWRLSIILSMLTYRYIDPNDGSMWDGSMSKPIVVFIILAFSWILMKLFASRNHLVNLFNKYPRIKRLDIENFYSLFLNEIERELSQDNTPIEELIGIGPGETESLEFKSSYWTNTEGDEIGKQNRCLEDAIVKEVAAFLNTNGGTLLIGINDDSPYGPTNTLENDLSHSPGVGSIGDLEVHIGQILENNLTCRESLNGFWRIRFPMYRGIKIIRIDIDKALEYVLAYQPFKQKENGEDKKRQFNFWRQGSRSKATSPQTWMEHIIDNWSK